MKLAILYSHLREFGGVEGVVLKQAELLRSYFKSPVPNIEIFRLISSLPLAPLTLKAFRNIEVLICHGYGPAPWIGFINKKIKGLRYVSYIHSPPRFLYLDTRMKKLWMFNKTRYTLYTIGRVGGQISRKLDVLSVRNSDSVLVNSAFTARRVEAIYGLQPVVCHPPVDTNVFKRSDPQIVQKTHSEFESPLILSSGRIVPIKRWEWLLEIMAYVKKTFPSATLAITGRRTAENAFYIQKLIELAKSLNLRKSVKFLGFLPLDELVKLYNAADIYAYQVPREDFGLGPVEAMACGTPVVVWNDGAGPCETVVNGKTGFRAKPYDIEDFAEKITKALDMDKLKVNKFSSIFVKKKFSWSQITKFKNNK